MRFVQNEQANITHTLSVHDVREVASVIGNGDLGGEEGLPGKNVRAVDRGFGGGDLVRAGGQAPDRAIGVGEAIVVLTAAEIC